MDVSLLEHGTLVNSSDVAVLIPRLLAHQVPLRQSIHHSIIQWMNQNFGDILFDVTVSHDGGPAYVYNKHGQWDHLGNSLWFRHLPDAVMFKLAWVSK